MIFQKFITMIYKISREYSKIDKRAGWNKAVQDGKFQFLSVKIKVLAKKYPKLINMQD